MGKDQITGPNKDGMKFRAAKEIMDVPVRDHDAEYGNYCWEHQKSEEEDQSLVLNIGTLIAKILVDYAGQSEFGSPIKRRWHDQRRGAF